MTRLAGLGVATPKRTLTRVLQVLLLGIVGYGLVVGAPKTITNGTIALAITFLPAIARRNYRVTLDPGLTLWLTGAVFLHTLGSAGLYLQVEWWDHLTHVLSASVVAAVGYVTVRTIDLYYETITLPRRLIAVYIVAFVLAFGVLWELFEYGLDQLAARTQLTMPLSQYGLADTAVDLTFNTIGAIIVAIWGQAYLNSFAEQITEYQQTNHDH